MDTFKRLLAYAKPYRRFWPSYLTLSILSVLFGVANYALINPLLTVLFTPDDVQQVTVLPEFAFSVDYANALFQYYLTKVMLAKGVLRGLVFVCLILISGLQIKKSPKIRGFFGICETLEKERLIFVVFRFVVIDTLFKTDVFHGEIFINPTAVSIVDFYLDFHFQHIDGNDDTLAFESAYFRADFGHLLTRFRIIIVFIA